jgi:Transglutaminase-like superfamily
VKKLLFPILLLAVILSGCENSNEIPQQKVESKTESKAESIKATSDQLSSNSSSLTVLDIKKKYDSTEQTTIMPMYNVEHDKKFKFTFNSNISDLIFFDTVITVHTDRRVLPESKVNTINFLEDLDAEKSVLVVEPAYAVLTSDETGRDDETSWGYAPIYYLRINYDLDANKPTKLIEPIIIPFTIKSELQAPNVRYEIGTDGRLKLVWDKVEGAEKYNIYNVYSYMNKEPIDGPEQGYRYALPFLVGTVTNTEFQDFYQDGNNGLNNEVIAEEKAITAQNFSVNGHYYVSAVKDGAESNFGPPVNTMELSKSLPQVLVDRELFYKVYDTLNDLPKTAKVTTIDNTILNRPILYEDIVEEYDGYALIPFKVQGTVLSGKAMVLSFDKEEWKKLNQVNKKNQQNNKEGFIVAENSTNYVPSPDIPTIISDDNKTIDEDDLINAQWENTERLVEEGNQDYVPQSDLSDQLNINADSAVEEYLALNLIAANDKISLKAFPEVQNFDTLKDTLLKVMFQNPLILDVKSYRYNYRSLTLNMEYRDSSENILKKQVEIIEEATQLVKSIIKDGMSDDEKRKAIYDYLNDYTKYDDAALANAEQNNFKNIDSRFNDSFNTYGILVKKVGVCASYASTYKLLSDLAGIESIVITGALDNVPHAWNKVKINGEWLHVDATNNETNSGIPYMLYNSNDETALELQFVTDNDYWINNELSQFIGKTNLQDYYVSQGLEMDSMEKFKGTLTKSIQQGNNKLIVRFDEPIDEETVYEEWITVYENIAADKMDSADYLIWNNYLMLKH